MTQRLPGPGEASLMGQIDGPASDEVLDGERIRVSGWLYDPVAGVVRVEVRLGGRWLGFARLGLARPDVAEALDIPGADRSGFELDVARLPDERGRAELVATATRADGTHEDLPAICVEMVAPLSTLPDRGPLVELDEPADGQSLEDAWITLRGWAFDPGAGVSEVGLWVDGHETAQAWLGRPRPDVAQRLREPAAALSGFAWEGRLRGDWSGSEVCLQAVATLLDGSQVPSAPAVVRLVAPRVRASAVSVARPERKPGRASRTARPIRLLVAARALDQSGSHLRMVELVEHLAEAGGFATTVSVAFDGPLRERVQAAGARVVLQDEPALADALRYESDIERLGRELANNFDVAYGSMSTTFPVLEACLAAGIPSVLRLGEAVPLPGVFRWTGARLDVGVEAHARGTFAALDAVVANSRAAIETYAEEGYTGRVGLLPEGVDIRAGQASDDERMSARRELDIDPHALLLVCVGNLWPVKGQAVLTMAMAELRRSGLEPRRSRPELRCALIGRAEPDYGEALGEFVRARGLQEHVSVHPFDPDMTRWWRAADGIVCSSETESLPGAVLEGMARGLPVVACSVGDIPRLIKPGASGWLCRPNDVASMRQALEMMAGSDPRTRRRMGRRAAKAVRPYDRERLLDHLTDGLRKLAAGAPFPLR